MVKLRDDGTPDFETITVRRWTNNKWHVYDRRDGCDLGYVNMMPHVKVFYFRQSEYVISLPEILRDIAAFIEQLGAGNEEVKL
jgi:hypothetical protein